MKKIFFQFFVLACVSTGAWAQVKLDTLPNLPDHYKKRLAAFRMEKTTSGQIIFLGNSITEEGKWRKLLKDSSVLNRGIAGDNTFGVRLRLDEIVRHKPRKLFILIGVNDLSKDTPSHIVIQNIYNIISEVRAGSPKTEIYLHSILPVNPSVKGFMIRFSKQSNIIEINGQIAKYGKAMNYTFVDIYSQFLDKNGLLNETLTYDGLHLNENGYQHWVEYLKKNKYL